MLLWEDCSRREEETEALSGVTCLWAAGPSLTPDLPGSKPVLLTSMLHWKLASVAWYTRCLTPTLRNLPETPSRNLGWPNSLTGRKWKLLPRLLLGRGVGQLRIKRVEEYIRKVKLFHKWKRFLISSKLCFSPLLPDGDKSDYLRGTAGPSLKASPPSLLGFSSFQAVPNDPEKTATISLCNDGNN